MKVRRMPIAALALLLVPAVSAGRLDVVESRTLTETIPLSAGGTLIVDNVYGPITITTHRDPTVRMVVLETIRARNAERIERARREVELVVSAADDDVELFVDGPFRDHHDGHRWSRNHWSDPGYRMEYAFELKVPRRIDIRLCTVDGDISVSGIRGDFRVHGVNGEVEMTDIGGSGVAQTVNGQLTVHFSGNPTEDSDFKTINGDLEVAFQDDLSADLRLKTMNGELLTDFEFSPVPPRAPLTERDDGQMVIRTDSWASIRVASGGPSLTFENLNGDILIRRSRR